MEVARADAREHRDTIVNLYRADGNRDVEVLFDWYYSNEAADSETWLLRTSDGRVVGTSSVVFRQLEYNRRPITVAVGGNLFVHPRHRSGLAAIRLIKSQKELLDRGECDLLLAIPLPGARKVLQALKFRRIGTICDYVHFLDTLPKLRGHLGPLALPLGLPANLGFSLMRSLSLYDRTLVVSEVAGGTVEDGSMRRWRAPSDMIVHTPSPAYVHWWARRPGSRIRVLRVKRGEEMVGLMCLRDRGETGASVGLCFWDDGESRVRSLLLTTLRHLRRDCEALSVPTVEGSSLAKAVRLAGFIPRESTEPGADQILGLWKDTHPLADVFGDARRWAYFPSLNDV